MLTNHQVAVARCILPVLEGTQFALVGGAALIARGAVDRVTNDLDSFTPDEADIASVPARVHQALERGGFHAEVERDSSTFVRLIVSRDEVATKVDFGLDVRLFPSEVGDLGPTVVTEELAVDKVLAMFGRAAARDFFDLVILTQLFELEQLFSLAVEKDLGFTRQGFHEALSRFDRFIPADLGVDDLTFESIARVVDRWKSRCQPDGDVREQEHRTPGAKPVE